MAPLEVGPSFGSWTAHYIHTGFLLINIQKRWFYISRISLLTINRIAPFPSKVPGFPPLGMFIPTSQAAAGAISGTKYPSVTVIFWWIFWGQEFFNKEFGGTYKKWRYQVPLLTSGCFFLGGVVILKLTCKPVHTYCVHRWGLYLRCRYPNMLMRFGPFGEGEKN